MRKKGRAAELQESLLEQGIVCESRQLPIGDYLWVVQEKADVAAAHGRAPREVCLSFVVERKRYDDFASSIMYRGRMAAQVHRFHVMQISHPVLLVERGQLVLSNGIDEKGLQLAACGLQVSGGFFVKFAADMRDIETYLVLCTRMIQQLLQVSLLARPFGSVVESVSVRVCLCVSVCLCVCGCGHDWGCKPLTELADVHCVPVISKQGCRVEAWTPKSEKCAHLRDFEQWGQPRAGRVYSFTFETLLTIHRRAAVSGLRA